MSYGDDEQTGAILGYEQPLSGKVSFVADWFSGKNFWGYFTPGISVTLPHSGLLNIGYALGQRQLRQREQRLQEPRVLHLLRHHLPLRSPDSPRGFGSPKLRGTSSYCGNANAM
jgi:hypothetical protein